MLFLSSIFLWPDVVPSRLLRSGWSIDPGLQTKTMPQWHHGYIEGLLLLIPRSQYTACWLGLYNTTHWRVFWYQHPIRVTPSLQIHREDHDAVKVLSYNCNSIFLRRGCHLPEVHMYFYKHDPALVCIPVNSSSYSCLFRPFRRPFGLELRVCAWLRRNVDPGSDMTMHGSGICGSRYTVPVRADKYKTQILNKK